jgi:phosphoribosylglycinamide formyltransferase 1
MGSDPILDSAQGRRIGVLISGRGSNLQAIIDAVATARLNAEIAVVISNRANALGIDRARQAGLEVLVLDHLDRPRFPTREEYDRELVHQLKARNVQLVCLAGFMRLLSSVFIDAFPDAILNIHPSLLPAFPGMNAQHQAWEHGVKYSGVTVHLVTAELDGGPIVLQEAVSVRDDDSPDTLSERVLQQEHRLYPEAIELILSGRWRLEGRRLVRA